MSQAFAINARMVLKGPYNVRPVVSAIRDELSRASFEVNPRLGAGANRWAADLASSLGRARGGLDAIARGGDAASRSLARVSPPQNAASGLSRMGDSLRKTARDADRTAASLREAEGAAHRFGRALGGRAATFGQFLLVVKAIDAIKDAAVDGAAEAARFQHEMTRLAQVGTSSRAVGEIADQVTRLSSALGTSSGELARVTTTLRQAGLSADEVRQSLDAIAKTTVAPTFESLGNTVEGSIALMRQFGIGARDLERSLGSINTVSAAFAVESEDLVTAVRKAGGAFKAAAGDASSSEEPFHQLLALFTSVRDTTRESADEIATGMRTIFGRLQSNRVAGALGDLNVQLRTTSDEAKLAGRDIEGQFVGGYEAIRRLSRATKDLSTSDPRFARVAEQIGGYRQISRVIPLLQQFEKAERAYAVAQAGGNSLTRDAEKAQGSFLVQVGRLKEEFFGLVRAVGDDKAFRSFLQLLEGGARVAIQLGHALKSLAPVVTTIGTALVARNAGSILAGAFGGGGRGRGPARTRRASGGVVPGTGRGDTVEHDGSPGDYVIRRDSARRIGYGALREWAGGRSGGEGEGGVPLLLEPGEFYIPAPDAKRIGRARLDHANASGKLPSGAAGGVPESQRRLAEKIRAMGGMGAMRKRHASGGRVEGPTSAVGRLVGARVKYRDVIAALGTPAQELFATLYPGRPYYPQFANGNVDPAGAGKVLEEATRRGVPLERILGLASQASPTGGAGSKARRDRVAEIESSDDPYRAMIRDEFRGANTPEEATGSLRSFLGSNHRSFRKSHDRSDRTYWEEEGRDEASPALFGELARSRVITPGQAEEYEKDARVYARHRQSQIAGKGGISRGDLVGDLGAVANRDYVGGEAISAPDQGAGLERAELLRGLAATKGRQHVRRLVNESGVLSPTDLAGVLGPADPRRVAEARSIRDQARAERGVPPWAGSGGGGNRRPPGTVAAAPGGDDEEQEKQTRLLREVKEAAERTSRNTDESAKRDRKAPGQAASRGFRDDGGFYEPTTLLSRIRGEDAFGVPVGRGPASLAGQEGHPFLDFGRPEVKPGSTRGAVYQQTLFPQAVDPGATNGPSEYFPTRRVERVRPGGDPPRSFPRPNRPIPFATFGDPFTPPDPGRDDSQAYDPASTGAIAIARTGRIGGRDVPSGHRVASGDGSAYGVRSATGVLPPTPVILIRTPAPSASYRVPREGEIPADEVDRRGLAARPEASSPALAGPGRYGRASATNAGVSPSRPIARYSDAFGGDEDYREIPLDRVYRARGDVPLGGLESGFLARMGLLDDRGGRGYRTIPTPGGRGTGLEEVADVASRNVGGVVTPGTSGAIGLPERYRSERRRRREDRVRARRARGGPDLRSFSDRLLGRRVVSGKYVGDLGDDARRSILDQAEAMYADAPETINAVREGRADLTLSRSGNLVSARDAAEARRSRRSRPGASGRVAGVGRAALGGGRAFLGGAGRFAGKFGMGGVEAAAGGGFLGAAFAADQYQQRFGTVRNPLGTVGQARDAAAVSGGLSGAAIGGSLGMVAGPVGAGIGAAVGGIAGFVGALKAAKDEIESIKFEKSFEGFERTLEGIANRTLGTDRGSLGVVNAGIARAGSEASRQVAASGAGGNWFEKSLLSFGEALDGAILDSMESSGRYDDKEIAGQRASFAATNDWFRRSFGASDRDRAVGAGTAYVERRDELLAPHVAGLQQAGSRLASELVLGNRGDFTVASGDTDADVRRKRENRLKAFEEAGGGDLARTIAAVNKTPLDEVLSQFDRILVRANRDRTATEGRRAGEREGDVASARFERFARSVDAASAAIEGLRDAGDSAASLLEGRGSASGVRGFAAGFDRVGGVDPAGVRRSADFLRNAGGGGGLAGDLGRRSVEIDEATRDLPSLLARAAAGGKFNEEGIAGDLDSAFQGLPREIADRLRGAMAGIDDADLLRRVGSNPEKLAKDLLRDSGLDDQVGQAADAASGLEAQINRFGEGLARASDMMDAVGESSDRRSQIGLDATRARADLRGASLGVDPSGLVSLEQLRAPSAARLARLAGPIVADPRDPAQIAARLRDATLGQRAQQAIIDDQSAPRADRDAAQERFAELNREAVNLGRALEHLADGSEDLSAIQEKLAAAERERSAQLSLAERLVTGDRSANREFRRGAVAAEAAAGQGSLEGFSATDARRAIEFLRSVGDARFSSGPLKGFSGNEGADRLLQGAAGGLREFGIDAGATRQRQLGLLGERAGVAGLRERAQAELTGVRGNLAADFLSAQKQANDGFKAQLEALVAAAGRREAQAGLSRAEVEATRVGAEGERARKAAARFSTPGRDDGFDRARRAFGTGKLGEIREVDRRLADLDGAVNRGVADEVTAGFLPGEARAELAGVSVPVDDRRGAGKAAIAAQVDALRRAAPALGPRVGLTADQVLKGAIPRFEEARNAFEAGVPTRDGRVIDSFRSGPELSRAIREEAREQQTQGRARRSDLMSEVGRAAYGTGNPDGRMQEQISRAARDLEAFGREVQDLKFDSLDAAQKALSRAMDERTKALQAAKAAGVPPAAGPVPPAQGLAEGGTPFRRRGTDTVPAMLTPEEYVVPRGPSLRHRALLEHMRAGGDPRDFLRGEIDADRGRFAAMRDDALEASRRRSGGLASARIAFRTDMSARPRAEPNPRALPRPARPSGFLDDFLGGLRSASASGLDGPSLARAAAGRRDLRAHAFRAERSGDEALAARYRDAVAEFEGSDVGKALASGRRRGRPSSGENAAASRRRHLALAASRRRRGHARYFADGGVVDSVPAVLSPDEFVVGPKQSRANRGLLERINSGTGPIRMASGGVVPGGTPAPSGSDRANLVQVGAVAGSSPAEPGAMRGFSAASAKLEAALGRAEAFSDAAATFERASRAMGDAARQMAPFAEALQQFSRAAASFSVPSEIQLRTQSTVEVVLNGGEFLKAMRADVVAEVTRAVMDAIPGQIQRSFASMAPR